MKKTQNNPFLESIYNRLSTQRSRIQHDGKVAFDRDDPVAARLEAGRLEQIDRAEDLLEELGSLLSELGIAEETVELATAAQSESKNHSPNTARKGAQRLAEKALHPPQLMEPVVDALRELGGEAHLRDIWLGVERMLGDSFTSSDREKMKSHKDQRWQYNIRWTLTQLKNDGRVEHAGKKGVWRLTASA